MTELKKCPPFGRTGDQTSCVNPTEKKHQCPYELDVYDVPEDFCTCCDDCKAECRDNI